MHALAESPDRALLARMGFLNPLIGLLQKKASSEAVQLRIMRVLAKLSLASELRELLAEAGAIPPLLRMLTLGANSPMAQAAAEVVRNLAHSVMMKDSLREAGVVRSALQPPSRMVSFR